MTAVSTRAAQMSESRRIEDGALYLVEERLDTFKDASWPYDTGSCTVVKIAEAGFYYCGSVQTPDWVRCVVCHTDVEGWEENDDPLAEHKKLCPKCPFLKLKDPYAITVRDCLDLEEVALQSYITMETGKLSEDIKSYTAEIREQLVDTIEQQKKVQKKK